VNCPIARSSFACGISASGAAWQAVNDGEEPRSSAECLCTERFWCAGAPEAKTAAAAAAPVDKKQVAQKRVCFISASFLVRQFTKIPKEVLDSSVFFFGSKRAWVFPTTPAEKTDSLQQPTNYIGFPKEFKELILKKEQDKLCYWLKPDCDYAKVSSFFSQIPVLGATDGKCCNALHIDSK
jgi:hypothetical protein